MEIQGLRVLGCLTVGTQDDIDKAVKAMPEKAVYVQEILEHEDMVEYAMNADKTGAVFAACFRRWAERQLTKEAFGILLKNEDLTPEVRKFVEEKIDG